MERLLSYALPQELVERFTIVSIEEEGVHRLRVHFDERPMPPNVPGIRVESKGFHRPQTIYDYPLRDRALILVIRRRRWRDAATGRELNIPLRLTAPGTSYTKEFGAFLKEGD